MKSLPALDLNVLHRFILLAGFCLVVSNTSSQAADDIVTAIPADVYSVQTAGSWTNEAGQTGLFRVVLLGLVAGQQSLHVQWLSNDQNAPQNTPQNAPENAPIIQTISEVADLTRPIIGVTALSSRPGELSIYLESDPGDNPDLPFGYEVFIIDADTYNFGPASN